MRLRISIVLNLALLASLVTPVRAQRTDPRRAGLIVVHGDGSVASTCVTFSAEKISGAELLQRSGLAVTLGDYSGLGYGVCAIDGQGCPAGHDCFCQCRGSPCAYWVYSHRRADGSWSISGVGASSWQIRDGDVDGWVWGDGSVAPPSVTFDQVCPPEEALPVVPTAGPETLSATTTPSPLPDVTPSPHALGTSETDNRTATPARALAEERTARLLICGVLSAVILGLASWLIVGRRR